MSEPERPDGSTWDGSQAMAVPLTVPNIEQDKIYINGKIAFDISQRDFGVSSSASLEWLPDRTPRTRREVSELLEHRPPAWEYLYYASCLLSEMREVAPRWADFEVGYVSDPRGDFGSQDPLDYVRSAMDQLRKFPPQVMQWFDTTITEAAFGKPGEPGNPSLIAHMAHRQVEVQGRMLDWAQAQRDLVLTGPYAEVVSLMSQIVGTPVKDFQAFVDSAVRKLDEIPAWVRAENRGVLRLELSYTMRLDDDLMSRISAALDLIKQSRA